MHIQKTPQTIKKAASNAACPIVSPIAARLFLSWKVKVLPFIYHIRQVRLENIRNIFHIL